MDYSAIGQQFGLDAAQTRAAFEALAPVVAAGMRRSGQGGGGLGELIGALAGGNPTRYAEDAAIFGEPTSVEDGNAILGEIFGSKDVSRGVARQVSGSTGLSEAILKKLLPLVAAYVMGQIAKKAFGGTAQDQAGGGLGDILGDMLGGGMRQSPGTSVPGGGLGDILGGILGGAMGQSSGTSAPGGGLGDILGDLLGGGGSSSQGINAADDLLNAVEQALGRR